MICVDQAVMDSYASVENTEKLRTYEQTYHITSTDCDFCLNILVLSQSFTTDAVS